jgi:cation diffusion facilitator family transporter
MELPVQLNPQSVREMRSAMRLSLAVGILMLVGKVTAYRLTGSAAILSDAAESIIHVVAVAFAAFSLWLSAKPADRRFPFGYERIAFFSAGFEGALIVLAAFGIIYAAIYKWLQGLPLDQLGLGSLIVFGAAVLNAGLGYYLLRVGKRNKSLILEANGRHVLTDSLTSFGVVAGLGLVLLTGWKPFDPIFAIAVALNILWSGGRLVQRSIGGLLDYIEPAVREQVETTTGRICDELGVRHHGLRFRNAGHRLLIEVHLLFPSQTGVGEAHQIATELEERLPGALDMPAEVTTHLESLEDHSEVHRVQHVPRVQ